MMLSRKAVIIGSPNVGDYLPGVEEDLKNYRSFLCSPKGGAWYEPEVQILRNPSKRDVLAAINACASVDYCYISFCGHGEHHVGEGLSETSLWLTERETIYVSELNPRNRRHTVVIDACRKKVPIRLRESFEALNKAYAARKAEVDWESARTMFDTALRLTAEGRIVAYSCEINQAAGENEKGGVFTQELLDAAFVLDTPASQRKVLDFKRTFEFAKERTYAENAPQNPVLHLGRRLDSYPFAII